ncbi:hypothetical protein MOMUL_23790 [Moorella mulderi DSM 14980]|uniref:Uncharacterized protein n=1 Tax=Moorella mulderi DSM 14980 TaxID=1122241 RepID=A0A151AUJ0_9FIRM|nr:hypothetical protein MOMUL_23790 [Moorella mulderi DSM 14980]
MLFPAAGHPAASPGGSSHPQASWETLADGSKVYGFWQDSGGYRFLIECDPATGQMTGFAYLNSGKFVEQEVQILDGYDQVQYIDTEQPKHYLYPPKIIPSAEYRGESLPIRYNGQEPQKVAYPYGSTLAEDWRGVIIPLLNRNPWPVTLRVHAFLNGDDWTGNVTIGPYDTKWVMLKIPSGAKAGGSNAYSTTYIFIHAQVIENYDPQAPPEYRYNPRADDGDVVAMYADIQGLKFSGPEWYDERDSQKVFVLLPAFKKVLRWVPDDPGDWRVGHPEYDLVPGYAWKTVEVGSLHAVAVEPTSILATQEDIDSLRAAGPKDKYDPNYYKTDGSTLTVYKKEKIGSGYDEYGHEITAYRYYYRARVVVSNQTGFTASFNDLSIASPHRQPNGDIEPELMPGRVSGGPIPPGGTGEFYTEFTQDNYALVNRKKNRWARLRLFSPLVLMGDIFNGIGGLRGAEACEGEVTISAIAGCENYNAERHYQSEFEPSLPVTMFDFEEVMTPAELARFANYVDQGIRNNIINFLAGHPEQMQVSAVYNRRRAIFDD